jgi:hypothetical protein
MTNGEAETDGRSTGEPSEAPPEEEADQGEAGEAHGPLGNPASDEESLRNRQLEGHDESGPGAGAD